jgi:hypothetical protein
MQQPFSGPLQGLAPSDRAAGAAEPRADGVSAPAGPAPLKPLCFVLMPFGRKPDGRGRVVDFDIVYKRLIAPAVAAVELDVIRADQEHVGGTIHKPMFERLLFCDYAVADLTGANPNVYYELGIRHAVRPRSTILLVAEGTALPFDIAPMRAIPYRLDKRGQPAAADSDVAQIAARLGQSRRSAFDDSPLFQLVEGMPRVQLPHSRADVFRERISYSRSFEERLAAARRSGKGALDAVRKIAGEPIFDHMHDVDSGVVVELFLSLRDVKGYEEMVQFHARMPERLQRTRLVQEQLAFALNRLKRHLEAERVLRKVIRRHGSSSETSGLLGRIYKDRWLEECKADERAARALLKRAIQVYLEGFEADWRDSYPGVNALTLMEVADDPRRAELMPVVRYAAEQRAARGNDYWDHAALLELAVLDRDRRRADDAAGHSLALVRQAWQLETTGGNLALIRSHRERRREDVGWIGELERQLADKLRRLHAG